MWRQFWRDSDDDEYLREQFLRRNYGGNLHEFSHGESFINLALNRFKPDSLFFFDEPEAALSPSAPTVVLASPGSANQATLPVRDRHSLPNLDGLSEVTALFL